MEKAAELLRRNDSPEGSINTVLSVFSYTYALPLDEKGECPNCGGLFPADLWEWYNELYCPYCGQRVQTPENVNSMSADNAVFD